MEGFSENRMGQIYRLVWKQREPQHRGSNQQQKHHLWHPVGKNTKESQINNTDCLLSCTHVCVFACVSWGNDSYASHTLLCQIDGSIGMPPVSLKTCAALRDGAKKERQRKNKENLTTGAESAGYKNDCVFSFWLQIYKLLFLYRASTDFSILADQHTANRFQFIVSERESNK